MVRRLEKRYTCAVLANEESWEAVKAKDAGAAGRFVYGVVTTGVYCSPGCSSRTPLRKNVRFYSTPEEAQRDGLRACKRCQPAVARDATAQRIEAICRYIEAHSEQALTLDALAERAGMSRFHFQRTFKAMVGVTPKRYSDAQRVRVLKAGLVGAAQVTTAMYDAGFGSTSRVYERSDRVLGMTPMQYRAAGAGIAITYAGLETDFGALLIAATDRGICFVQFGTSEDELTARLREEFSGADVRAMEGCSDPQLDAWSAALRRHLTGAQPHLELPTDIRATAFQIRVWAYLQSIPYGQVQSYAQVARGIGQPHAARAVARACATNHVAIVIPCHRVIRGDGGLGGYKWGVDRKRALLERERASSA